LIVIIRRAEGLAVIIMFKITIKFKAMLMICLFYSFHFDYLPVKAWNAS